MYKLYAIFRMICITNEILKIFFYDKIFLLIYVQYQHPLHQLALLKHEKYKFLSQSDLFNNLVHIFFFVFFIFLKRFYRYFVHILELFLYLLHYIFCFFFSILFMIMIISCTFSYSFFVLFIKLFPSRIDCCSIIHYSYMKKIMF